MQKGIQAAHVVAELLTDDKHPEFDEVVDEWARKHKTVVMLEGGNYGDIRVLREFAEKSEFPSAEFHEDVMTMGGLTTAVCVLAPSDIKIADYLDVNEETRYVVTQIKTRKKVTV